MRWGSFLTVVFVAGSAAAQPVITPGWSLASTSGTIDGLALGDLNGDGLQEVVAIVRNGGLGPDAALFENAIGVLAVMDAQGAVLWQVELPSSASFPSLADFDGDGLDEIAVCENALAGVCRIFDGNGTLLVTTGTIRWLWASNNGPSAADLNGDGFADLIVATWMGDVVAFSGQDGSSLWTTVLEPNGAQFFGSVAIGDIDGDGQNEIVVCDAINGAIFGLEADGSVMPNLNGIGSGTVGCLGTGPALVDLDGGGLDIVVTRSVYSSGAGSELAAYNASGTELFSNPVAGETSYLSPVVGDVDGDGEIEIFFATLDGTFGRRAADGTILTVNLGAQTWSMPVLIDCELDGLLEVLVTNGTDIIFLDGVTLAEHSRVAGAADGLYPAVVYDDIDGDLSPELLTGSFWDGTLVTFDMQSVAGRAWPAHMASQNRQGSASGGAQVLPADPPGALIAISSLLQQIANDPSTPKKEAKKFAKVAKEVDKALKDLNKGDIRDTQKHIRKAMKKLNKIAKKFGTDVTFFLEALLTVSLNVGF